ncbi:MAG: ATP synthase F1 subunit delta [Acidobacteriota bacterium]
MSLAVATRYARSLADVVLAPGSATAAPAVMEQLKSFGGLLEESADLRNVLLSPAVPPARKRAVVAEFGRMLGFSPVVKNFLFVVIDHRRVNLLGTMAKAFEEAVDERLGRVRADVRSALPLTEDQRATVSAQLRQLSGKEVRCEFEVEDSLLGGLSARIGSKIYDGSVRGRLDVLRQRLSS